MRVCRRKPASHPLQRHTSERRGGTMADVSLAERTDGWQPRLAQRLGIHYGWVVVAVTLPTMLVAAGLRATPGVVIRPWENEFGWDRAAISTIIAVSWIAYGIANPLAGRLIDAFG